MSERAWEELNLVVERPDHALVLGQQPNEKLFGGLLEELEVPCHAGAGIEHDDDGDRLDFVDEQVDSLRLVVVEDLEVFLRQVRNQSLLSIVTVAYSATVRVSVRNVGCWASAVRPPPSSKAAATIRLLNFMGGQ